MSNRTTIGLSQRLQLEWLERTALLYISGISRSEIQQELETFLQDKISVGTTSQGQTNRKKTIGNLLKIWVSPPDNLESFRDAGLQHLKEFPFQSHLVLHWGMTMATYPFFYVVAETVGRLLRIQGTVTAAQIHRRMKEQLGERSTVERATRRVISTLRDWGSLQSTEDKGLYKLGKALLVDDTQLITWLIEATLIASQVDSSPLRTITHKPALFPFDVQQKSFELPAQPRIEIVQQGLNQRIVMLR